MKALDVGSDLEGGEYIESMKGKLNHQDDYVILCISFCGYVCSCVGVESRGQVSFTLYFFIFLKQYLSLNLALVCSDKLAGRQAPKSLLCPFPSTVITSRHHQACFYVSSSDSVLLLRTVKYYMETSLYSPVLCGFKHAWFSNSLARIPGTPEF